MSSSATARTTDDALMVPSWWRALTLGAPLSQLIGKGILIPSFRPQASLGASLWHSTPAQVSGHGDRVHLYPPPSISGHKARDSWVSHPCSPSHRGMVLEKLASAAGATVSLPLLVWKRSWILSAASSRRSARLMAN